jgi:P-type Ca2+ transporter type 2C
MEGVDNIANKIGSNTYSGLNGTDFKQRTKQYGNNVKKEIEREGLWNMWVGALDDLMLKILIVAAFVSMVISLIFAEENAAIAWIEGGAILMAVFVVSGVTAWNDYKKEEQFIELTKFSDS